MSTTFAVLGKRLRAGRRNTRAHVLGCAPGNKSFANVNGPPDGFNHIDAKIR